MTWTSAVFDVILKCVMASRLTSASLLDPTAFDRAVRHLFRHLQDPSSLRTNPIAQHFFGDLLGGGLGAARAVTGLTELRAAILEGAEIVRKANIAVGKHELAHRQYSIIKRLYLDKESISNIMQDLGISRRQFYRDRQHVCNRIASFILERRVMRSAHTSPQLDIYDFKVSMARAATDCGDLTRAAEIYAEAIRELTDTERRLDIACEWINAALEYGEYGLAGDTLRRAASLTHDLGRQGDVRVYTGRLALASAIIAAAVGRRKRARSDLARACTISEQLPVTDKRVPGLLAEISLEFAHAAAGDGRFNEACTILDEQLRSIGATADHDAKTRFEVCLWRAGYDVCQRGPLDRCRANRNLRLLYDVRERARLSGYFKGILEATVLIGLHYCYLNKRSEAITVLREAIEMARKFPNRYLRGQVLLSAADCFLATSQWSEAFSLVSEAEPDLLVGGESWAKAQVTKAEYFLRVRNYDKAWQAGSLAEQVCLRLESDRHLGGAWRTLALAAHGLGRRRESKQRIEDAIPCAERSGTAASVAHTYEFASIILSSSYFAKAAREYWRQGNHSRKAAATDRPRGRTPSDGNDI